MERQMQRIITGQTSDGKSVFTHVEAVEPMRLGGDMLRHVVWSWDETPTLPYYKAGPYEAPTGSPAGRPGEVQIEKWVLPPRFPLEGGHEDSSRMHSYDTIDVVFVLEGEIDLQQSDGVVVRLRRGDVLVQNGAVHTWRNPTDERCVLGFVFFGAARKGASD
ncbi:MAG TPA: cupin domain-containing protein [Steroidobacteraceae bacterium]|nr:cupin domain-containing protein [Steroidobacteraceae bacterium]